MKLLLLAATIAAAVPASADPLSEAAHAVAAGRFDQARIMVGVAVKAGAKGDALDRVLADLAFNSGNYPSAWAGYEALLKKQPSNPFLAERAGIAAFHAGAMTRAANLLENATTPSSTSWRAWNARGVVADHRADWEIADLAYASALALQPDQAAAVNNLGWSLLLRGRWAEAVGQLERAAVLDPKSRKIADNLDLARIAVAEELPRRRPHESDSEWAARLNDAGVIAKIRGEEKRAIAAFAQAIEARSVWFERAANNLALVEAAQ